MGCCCCCPRKGHNFMALEFSLKPFQTSLCVLTPPIPFASTVRMRLIRWQQFYFSYNLTSPFTMGNYRDQTQNPFLFLLYRCSSPWHFQQAALGQHLALICGPPFGAACAWAGGAVFVCSTVCTAAEKHRRRPAGKQNVNFWKLS